MDLKIYKTKYWQIELCPDQYYIGRCIIILNRECKNLAELNNEEFLDLLSIIKTLELSIKKSFNPTMFNWACLMNDAYKSENPKPWVHFHLRPRYKFKLEFEGEIFEDKEFAHHYDNHAKKIVPEKVLLKIIKKIQRNIRL